MPSVDELLNMAEVAEATLTETNDVIEIDADTRTMIIPDTERIFGVMSDEKGERKYFRCKRFVGNGIDLSKLDLRVIYQNASGLESGKDKYIVTDLATDGEDYVTFSWELSRKVTAYKGIISFIVCAIKTGTDGTITNEWNTTLANGIVLDGLEVSGTQEQEKKAYDYYKQLEAELEKKAQEVIGTIPSDYTQTLKDVRNLKGEVTDGRTDVDGNVHKNIGDAMRGQARKLRGNLVVRQKEQPTDPNNNVWISDEDDEVEVPDMGEFNSLKEDLDKLNESFIVEPNNYVDYSKIEKSKELQQNSDELISSNTYSTTDYIPVKSGEELFFSTNTTPQSIVFLKGFNSLRHGISWTGNVKSYKVPENVTYVRATFYSIWLDYKFQICKGSIKAYSEYHIPYVSVNRDTLSYDVRKNLKDNYITCWGDSLTQQGGWTDIISELSGYPIFNSGIGGETAFTIMGRQGADTIIVNNVTIPSDTTPVVIGTYKSGGLDTICGNKALPLANSNTECMNPCSIGCILGNVKWTGSSPTDENGTWTFTRLKSGAKLNIDRPTGIITNYSKYNKGITIIWIGTNGGYGTESNLININRLMIEHSGCENKYVVLGVCNNTAAALKGYEDKLVAEFGGHFINIRKYLSTPVYDSNNIVSSYGLLDADLNMTEQDKNDIQNGRIPSSLRSDSTHFNEHGKLVIGKYIYKRMNELGMFS